MWRYKIDVKEKLPENDRDVVIKEDVCIGVNAIILKGVTVVDRGSVVATGSIVTKDIAPYSIVAGVPAKIVKMRFTQEQIVEHEANLIIKGRKI